MTKILFADIDGTLTETISGSPFKRSPNDIKIIEGADKAIAHFAKQGWTIIGISNQGRVAAGHKSLEDTFKEMKNTLKLFPEIKEILFCPSFEGEYCWVVDPKERSTKFQKPSNLKGFSCRKPDTGMVTLAMDWTYNLEEKDCWMVGDRPEDEQCANNAGINFCPANLFRNRFLKGIQESWISPAQLEFLEKIKL